jgi:hypothetical protein
VNSSRILTIWRQKGDELIKQKERFLEDSILDSSTSFSQDGNHILIWSPNDFMILDKDLKSCQISAKLKISEFVDDPENGDEQKEVIIE